MANVTITQLPVAGPILGTELVPIVQDGQTRQTTTSAIAASPSQLQTFLTLNQEATLPNSRRLSVQTGLGLTDGGALSTLALSLNGASGALETALAGIVAKTGSATVVARTLTASGLGLSITDGNGVAGNPTFALTGQVAGIANLTGPGMVSVGGGSVNARALQGTASEISVANGDGSSNPTFRLALNPVIPGTAGVTIPVGTTAERGAGADGKIRYNSDLGLYEAYSAGNWDQLSTLSVTVTSFSGGATGLIPSSPTTGAIILDGVLAVDHGGTGQSTFSDGQLLIGSSAGNTLATSTLTAGSSIAITNGPGSITISIASTVAITGGTIDNTIIGGTTPAAGTFTSVTMTSGTITTAPVNGNDIVNKTYADSIASGINFHQSCRLATTAALPSCTYNNGTSGVGATLTATANGPLSVDTTLVAATNRILVKNQANAAHNGVYTVTQVGDISPGAPFILTRATDFDSTGSGVDQIDQGDFFLITAGSTLANTSWVQQTPLPITIGTTGIVFSQFGAPLTYSAGTGLNESPAYTFNIANTGVSSGSYGSASSVPVLSVNAQGQITTAVSTSIAIDASQVTSGALAVVNGGTGQTTYTDGQLLIGNSTGNTLTKAALTAGANVTITNGPGSITIAASGGTGTVTSVGQTFTGGLISVSGSPITSSGTLALTVAGTSGGIPYFSGGTTWASSSVLAANALMVGGGAGAAPSTVTTGTNVLTALGVNVGLAGAFVVNGGALGAPSSGTLTNATGLPISTGVSGLGTGVATALAVNTGTAGAFVVNGGALGTPSSGTLTNATGLPISTGVSGLGTGVATALAVNTGSSGAFVVNGGALGTPSSGTLTNATGLPLATGVTGTLPVARGGTGQTTYTNGQLLIGNTTGNTLSKATLSPGSGISITNGAGSITISATGGGVSSVSGSSPIASSGGTNPVISLGIVPVNYGGTGTTTPSLVAGTNVTISGAWPNQTINSTGGGGGSSWTPNTTTGGSMSITTPAGATTSGGIVVVVVASEMSASSFNFNVSAGATPFSSASITGSYAQVYYAPTSGSFPGTISVTCSGYFSYAMAYAYVIPSGFSVSANNSSTSSTSAFLSSPPSSSNPQIIAVSSNASLNLSTTATTASGGGPTWAAGSGYVHPSTVNLSASIILGTGSWTSSALVSVASNPSFVFWYVTGITS